MSNVLELSAGTQGVDVQDRFAGLRKSSEGAQGFDIGPVIVTAVVQLLLTARPYHELAKTG